MLVLALDSSSTTLSCALVETAAAGSRVLAASLHPPPARAGDLLPAALGALCDHSGRTLESVEALAVGLGPGSFTGLRVGLASAKALAYARRLPLAGASSLRALALAARAHAAPRAVLVATAEARKGELYAAAFRSANEDLHEIAPAAVFRPEAFEGFLRRFAPAPVHVLGPGAASCAAQLAACAVDLSSLTLAAAPRTPPAAAVAALAATALSGARFDAAALFSLAPDYHKPSEAEVALGEGRVGGLTPPDPRR